MKSIKERYSELISDEEGKAYCDTVKALNVINEEYFDNELRLKLEEVIPYDPITFKYLEKVTFNNVDFISIKEFYKCLDYAQSIYELRTMKRKLERI